MLYGALTMLANVVTHCIFRIKVVGRENVPKNGGMILAVNHKSNWDPIIAGAYCPRKLRFMAKSDLFKNKLFGALITKLGAFPIQRGKGDIGAIKGAFSILKNNDAMLMFPEGRRVKNNQRVKAKIGVSMIATHSRVPVIPLCISGDYRFFHKLVITFGEPVLFDEYYEQKLDNDKLQALADGVMDTIYSFDVVNKKGEDK